MINFYDEININETIWIPQKNENLTENRVLNSELDLTLNISKSTIEKCPDSKSCLKYKTFSPKQTSMFLVNQNCMDKKILVFKSDEIRKFNSNTKKRFNKKYIKKFDIEEKPIMSKISSSNKDLLIIDILNRFIFFMFLFFILSLNFFGLYIFPYFLKKPLSIDD